MHSSMNNNFKGEAWARMGKYGWIYVTGVLAILSLGIGGWFLFARSGGHMMDAAMNHGPMDHGTNVSPPVPGEAAARPTAGTVTVVASVASPAASQGLIHDLEMLAGVHKVEPFLVTKASDGTKVFGVDVRGPLRLPVEGKAMPANILKGGRGFQADESDQPIMLVGKAFAETHKTPFGYKILGMVKENHKPYYYLERTQFSIQGIYTSGHALADAGIALPLAAVQKLYALDGKLSGVYVTVEPSGAAAVEEALKRALGAAVRILVLR